MTGFDNFGNQLNNPNQPKLTRAQWKEFQVFKEEYAENERTRNILLQRQNDILEGGIRSANIRVFPASYVINAQDSLDASYPLLVHFNILPEMVKIVSIKLSFWFLNFRAYSKGASSGGAVSSASGGGETPTSSSVSTPSGGGATSGAKGSASGGGATSGSKTTPSGGGATSGAGGATTPTSSVDSYGTVVGYYPSAAPSFSHNIGDENIDGFIITQSVQYTLSTKNHTHTVTIPNHYHSTPNHTHPSHTHTTPNHTHPNHTHSTPNHTHPAHDHTVTIAAHTHTGGAHTHGITYGIFEEETSPTIVPSISRDNGLTYSLPMGSYTKDQENLDITRFIDTKGSKMIKFTSNARARLSVQVTIRLDVKAR